MGLLGLLDLGGLDVGGFFLGLGDLLAGLHGESLVK